MLPLTIDTLPTTSKGLVKFVMTKHGWKRVKARYGVHEMKSLKELIHQSVIPSKIVSIQNGKLTNTYKVICRNGVTIIAEYKKGFDSLVICTIYKTDQKPKYKKRKQKGVY